MNAEGIGSRAKPLVRRAGPACRAVPGAEPFAAAFARVCPTPPEAARQAVAGPA